jgi:hypothetical protein
MSRTGIMGTRFISCFSRLNIGSLNFTSSGQPRADFRKREAA